MVDGLSLCIYYRVSTEIISKKCMNEDSVALIMCEKCIYKDRELSADIFLKDTSCYFYFCFGVGVGWGVGLLHVWKHELNGSCAKASR